MHERSGLWRPAFVAFGLMGLGFVRALSWQWLNEHGDGARLTPRGEHLLTAVALAMPLIPAFALLWVAVSRRLVTRLVVVLGLLVVLGAVGGAGARLAWTPFFSGHYEGTTPSPDGAQEAHVHLSGLFGCAATVYVSQRRGLWGTPAATRRVDCDDAGARWLEDGGVEVTGGAPRPLLLDLGPH